MNELNTTANVLPFTGEQPAAQPSPTSNDSIMSEILQGTFASEDDRQTFLQAVTMHGVTLLCCAHSPLPRPPIEDLSAMERITRAISRVWSHPSISGGICE